MRPRFTLAGLLILVLLCGVGFAALRHPTGLTAGLLFTGTALALGIAVLGSILLRRKGRAVCIGAAVFGLGYLSLAFGPWASETRSRLVTTLLLDGLYEKLHPTPDDQVVLWETVNARGISSHDFSLHGRLLASGGGPTIRLWNASTGKPLAADPADFQCVGHSLAALFAALLGGLIARHFHARGDQPGPPHAPGAIAT